MSSNRDDGDVLRLLDRLPFLGAVARDVAALRALLLDRRAPRVLALGAAGVGKTSIANALLRDDALPLLPRPTDDAKVSAGSSEAASEPSLPMQHGSWVSVRGRGRSLSWLELLPNALTRGDSVLLEHALDEHLPDVILGVVSIHAESAVVASLIEALADVASRVERREGKVNFVIVVTGADRLTLPEEFAIPPYPADALAKIEANLRSLRQTLEKSGLKTAERTLAPPIACALPYQVAHQFNVRAIAEALFQALPEAARIEGVRALPVGVDSKRTLARKIIQHTSSVAVTVGLAPIPFADALILLPIQALLVTSIAYIAGAPWDKRSAAEYLSSLGLTGGAAFGLRLGAQQLIKLIPGAGSLISGSVAGAGTLALGRGAIAYFIDGPGQRALVQEAAAPA